jgi:hypothetical protein
MPSRQDMQFAQPLCRRRRVIRDGQHGLHVTCWQPMVYVDWGGGNQWWCDSCQLHTDGHEVAAAQRAVAAMVVAA